MAKLSKTKGHVIKDAADNVVKRILPATVYDTLAFMALAFGGIGQGLYHASNVDESGREGPCCALGFAQDMTCAKSVVDGPNYHVFVGANISEGTNDLAVTNINLKKKTHPEMRVTFREWCKELKVERGED